MQCPYGQYGMNCSEKCLCQNNARCDPVNGICTCAPGFMGPLCSYPGNGIYSLKVHTRISREAQLSL